MTWPPRDDEPTPAEVRGFFDHLADHPDDHTARLVFADWLEERGDPRAELLRTQADYVRAGNDHRQREAAEVRGKAWEATHGPDWLGRLPPPANAGSLDLARGLLEVMGFIAPQVLRDDAQRGLRHALREGWISFFRMTFWSGAQIREAAGLGLLAGPRSINLLGGQFGDDAPPCLGDLPRLRELDMGGGNAGLSDDGLAPLAGLTRLEGLSLWSFDRLTGAGLAHLSGLTRLRWLSLYNCPALADAGLAHLAALPHLDTLSLGRARQVTDAGVAHLAGLVALRDVDLSECAVTDAGLAHLAGLTGLRKLDLGRCPGVTDAGLVHLAGLTQLEELNLGDGPRVTGVGVRHLHGLTNLKQLGLQGCRLKPHETRAMGKALPGCEVVRK